MKETIFLNGKFLPADEAKIAVTSPGFLCGLGLFETMRSYNKKIVYFDTHLERIKNSCRVIDLKFPYTLSGLKDIINKTVEINAIRDAYVRLTLGKSASGTDVSVIVKQYKPYAVQKYKTGFKAKISTLVQNENSLLSKIKTTNRLMYEISFLEAKQAGFDEALILNNAGFITETSRSNIFLVKNQEIFTPYLECGCLDGITRKAIFDLAKKCNIKASEGNFTLQDLYYAQEVFLTNSLIGVIPLVSVEKQIIGKGKRGKISEFFTKEYNLLFKHAS
jgi:branched-subunit amino acid aminotransferase/4-amino-4-deoxychorismate lyase